MLANEKLPLLVDSPEFRLLFASNPLPMWVYDLETLQFLEVNEAAVALYGYARDEFLRLRLAEIGAAGSALRPPLGSAGGRPGLRPSGEGRHRGKDGRLIEVEVLSHVLRFGNRQAMLAVVQDITQRRRAEAALQASEARHRELVEGATDIIYTIDLSGRFTSVNPAGLELTGYSLDEALAADLSRVVAPEHLDLARTMMARRLGGDTSTNRYEIEIIAKDGRRIPVEVSTRVIMAAGKPVGIQGIARDISARRQAETALRESEERFRALTEHAAEGVSMIDADGTLRYLSPSADRMLGYTADERVGASWNQLIHPEDAGRMRHLFDELLRRPGGQISAQLRCRHKDGSWRWMDGVATNLLAEPSVGAIVVNYRDITARREAEDENARLQEAQARRVAELEALISLSRSLRSAEGPAQTYPIITEFAMNLLRADSGALMLADAERATLTCAYARGNPAQASGASLSLAGSLSGWVVLTGVTYLTEDFLREAVPAGMAVEPYRAFGPVAIVPVCAEQKVVGTLEVARKRAPGRTAFTESDLRLLNGIAEIAGAALRRTQLHEDLQQTYAQVVLALAHAIESRDSYTAVHSVRLVAMAEAVARELGCGREEVDDIRWAALLHDIGKIGVPDSVLVKPRSLTEAEWEQMRRHPVIGEEILKTVKRMHGVAKIVRHHQERWDGEGYPDALRGERIPFGARILAVVDAYGAMTETRPYKPAATPDAAMAEIRRCAGTQFDPRVALVFLDVAKRFGI
ncbi:MAG TPA: PAS domain S-box protein [bacterium]|nr:PAS domain S-box protein [bacterium]